MIRLDADGVYVKEEYPGELKAAGYDKGDLFLSKADAIAKGKYQLDTWIKAGAFKKFRRFKVSNDDISLFKANDSQLTSPSFQWSQEDINFLIVNEYKVVTEGERYRLYFFRPSPREPEWVRKFNESMLGRTINRIMEVTGRALYVYLVVCLILAGIVWGVELLRTASWLLMKFFQMLYELSNWIHNLYT